MEKKNSAYYQREFRKRQKEKGFVKKEVWIKPEHTDWLLNVENAFRLPTELAIAQLNELLPCSSSSDVQPWTIDSLYLALQKAESVLDQTWLLEKAEQAGLPSTLKLTLKDFGGLPVYINITQSQILVECFLWPEASVIDTKKFNKTLLKGHKYYPLSTLCLEQDKDGESWYQLFGALSRSSKFEVITEEVETLADNVFELTEALMPLLQMPDAEIF